jgi:cytochrome P450
MATETDTEGQETQRCPVRHDYQPYSPHGIDDPMGMIAPIRAETPVFFCEQTSMWIISRYEDVLEALKDNQRLSANAFPGAPIPESKQGTFPDGMPIMKPSLVNGDPPAHTRVRKLANRSFTRARIESMRPAVQAEVATLIDAFASRGRCELISEFSAQLPAATMGAMLGLAADAVPRILQWGDAVMVTTGTMRVPEDQTLASYDHVAEFCELVNTMVADRRAHPREDDFVTDLVMAADEDEPALTDTEILSMMCQFIIAGHETTRHLIGSTIHLLLKHPRQLDAVRANPELAQNAIEETLRHSGPAKGMFRVAKEDVEIGGVRIPAGDRIQIMFGSANRDPEAWENPDAYDLSRGDLNRHVAFGKGTHFCIGAPLARLQANIAVPELLRRLPGLRFADGAEPTSRIPSLTVSGLRRLDVEWEPTQPFSCALHP